MAEQAVTANLQVIKFESDFAREYVRINRFAPYAGTGMDSVIHIREDRGPTIRFPLLTRATGSGVSGSTALRGNGESIGNHAWDCDPTYYRHAVEFNKEDAEKSNIDLMSAARPFLLDWSSSGTRDRMIDALSAAYDGTTYTILNTLGIAAAGANTWYSTNSDRIIMGANIANTGDISTDLGGVDATTDIMTAARVNNMRRLAETCDPHIRPIMTDSEGEVFVLFVGVQSFYDLKANLTTVLQNADVRGMIKAKNGNILARDGDLLWNGVIVRKIPEITTRLCGTGGALDGVGGSSIDVEAAFLCGAQALTWGLGQRPKIIVDKLYDFEFRPGVAVELKEDIQKPFFKSGKQHGVVTGFFSGAAA